MIEKSVSNPASPRHLDDDATEDDCLGRLAFARSLAAFIRDAPDRSSYRVGLYGGWGEGKTSVMKMMDKMLASDADTHDTPGARRDEHAPAHKCLLFVSWSAQTADELRAKLLQAIADRLGLLEGADKRVSRGLNFASRAWQGSKEYESKLKALDFLAQPALEWAQ